MRLMRDFLGTQEVDDMGIKRGNMESAALGALAKSANPSYHHHASVASGLGALANGLRIYAESWGEVSRGLRAWGEYFTGLSKQAVKADAQQKESERMADGSMEEFNKAVKNEGLTENDARYWQLHDEAVRWRDRADHQGLLGVYSSPQPTREWQRDDNNDWALKAMTEERKQRRRAALSIPDDSDEREKRSYGFGGIFSWDGEED